MSLAGILGGINGITSTIQGIGGAVDTIQGFFGNSAADRARDDAWAKQKWLLNYNTPLNQRKRMEEAGFNPALMMQAGNFSTSMPSGPTVTPTRTTADNIRATESANSAIRAMIDISMMDARTRLLEAQADSATSNAELNRFKFSDYLPAMMAESKERAFSTKMGNLRAESLLPGQIQAQEEQNRKTSFEVQKIISDIKTADLQRDGITLDNTRKEIENSQLSDRLKAELIEIQERTLNYAVTRRLQGRQADNQEIQNYIDNLMSEMATSGGLKSDPWFVRWARNLGIAVDKATDGTSSNSNGAGGKW